MKYVEFYNSFKDRPLIDVREVRLLFPDFQSRRLFEWQKKSYITKLSRLFYFFTNHNISEAEKYFIANRLVEPSYISMEMALRCYDLIPETVYLTTCITTRKTRPISTVIGDFRYQSIKENLFFGYKLVDFGGIIYKMAEPEKAILDFLYLRSDIVSSDDIEELRLNEEIFKDIIDQEKLQRYLTEFDCDKLTLKIKRLNKMINA